MKLLIALLAAIGAVAAGVFFWRKNQESAGSTWIKRRTCVLVD